LTATEYELLTLLAKNPSRLFTREELLESVKGMDFEGLDRVIDTHIKNIRQKIEPEPKQPIYILTVRGSGYRFGGKR
jgi:DNA-binding response OmpR family regulator